MGDDFENVFRRARNRLNQACTEDEHGNLTEARRYYLLSIDHLNEATKLSKSSKERERITRFMRTAKGRISFIDGQLKNRPTTSISKVRSEVSRPSTASVIQQFTGVEQEIVKHILNNAFMLSSNITFTDVGGNEEAKSALREAMVLPMLRPDLFTGLRSSVSGVLLFGPPGNGKTMLAKAVAGESKCALFNVSPSSVLSKWFGESERTLKCLFTLAHKYQPAIIFIDEVETLMATRNSSGTHDTSRRVLTELLTQMDGVQTGSGRLLVLGATNRPQELDEAARRRFVKRIYVGLPDEATRMQIIDLLLQKEKKHEISSNDLIKIAKLTDGYSASDLKALAMDAAHGPTRELTTDQLLVMEKSHVRPIRLCDFLNSLKIIRASVQAKDLCEMSKWNAAYGGAGSATSERQGSSSNGLLTQVFHRKRGDANFGLM